jgi:hypothetical protein
MNAVPTPQQIELFRAVEDIHELSGARLVLLVDADGQSVAVSGDEVDLPAPFRAVLSGKRLAAAGSVRALLEPLAQEVAHSDVNVTVHAVDGSYVLAIVFGSEADFESVQVAGNEGRQLLAELLAP